MSVKRIVVGSVLAAGLIFSVPAIAQAQSTTKALPHVDESTLVVKLKPGVNAQLSGTAFTGSDTASISQLNSKLSALHLGSKSKLVPGAASVMHPGAAGRDAVTTSPNPLANYYVLKVNSSQQASDVAEQLKQLGAVETAYAKPLPAPAPSTPSYVSKQTYLQTAPTGLGVSAKIGGTAGTSLYPGSNGADVQVADLEYSWNINHEDLAALRASGALWANGTPSDPFSDNNHGTAVAGMIAGTNNSYGVTGIASGTRYHMVNTYNDERGWDLANSIYTAANNMHTGDVMLIEQQAWAPDNTGYAPIEIYPDVFDAIQYATGQGITVVEPAGNGNPNTDTGYDLSSSMFDSAFTSSHPSSGALIVGAGGTGCSTTREVRMSYSNYGTRVDLQGTGECIVSTGYGDLYWPTVNSYYTGSFGGTSSASASIAGVAAELSSSYKQINGTALSPTALKSDLIYGGTPQNTSVNSGNIGVLPNMASALKKTDITRPSTPTSFKVTIPSTGHITSSWRASSDNLGFVRYRLYKNGVLYKTLSTLSYTDTSVKRGVKYTYKVQAVDGSGNLSAFSSSISIIAK